jgi:hypothetical protein
MNHRQTQTHKTHHGPDLGEVTTFPLIVYYVFELTPKCHFVPVLPNGNPKIPTTRILITGIPVTLRPITLHANLQLRWGLKQSCNPHWEFFNSISYTTCTQGNWGDSQLLMVGSQIVNLTPGFSFGYNLCAKCSNGSREPILDIYVPRAFQWYNELFNPMGFDPSNCSLKIQKSTGTPSPKVGAHLGVWRFIPSHSLALLGAWNVTLELPSWPTPLQAFALVTSPRLRLWQQLPWIE